MTYYVAAFYKFTPLVDYKAHRKPLAALACAEGVKGTILLAEEGVNGTIAGATEGVQAVLSALRALPGCADLEHKESIADAPPFKRLKVRLKKEIVTMGIDVDAATGAGTYVTPEEWNALIADPDVAVVDARNDYEVGIGCFDGAIDPQTENFGDLPAWLDDFAAGTNKKKLAMYCTGGIRCEKSTAYAKRLGFEEVYHLKGGILKYLEVMPPEDSLWNGECYVFNGRVSVRHGLAPGAYELCGACGRPISDADKSHKDFELGVSCAFCIGLYSDEQRERFRHRQYQIDLAAARGLSHFGPQNEKHRKQRG